MITRKIVSQFSATLILVLVFGVQLFASLPPHTLASRYAHLAEVNDRWIYEVSPSDLLKEVQYSGEAERIADHLLRVANALELRDKNTLSQKQLINRKASIVLLRAYAKTGKFPINAHHDERTPYFVDELGTHCAVGYLMRETGFAEAVNKIRTETNYGYVLLELSKYPEISAWGQEHGFTDEELAWIQPAYTTLSFSSRPFGNNLGVAGGSVYDGVSDSRGIYVAGDFTEVDGTGAAGLAYLQNELVEEVVQPYPIVKKLFFDTLSQLLYAHGIDPNASSAAVFTIDEAQSISVLPITLSLTDSIFFKPTLQGVVIVQQSNATGPHVSLYHHTEATGITAVVPHIDWQGFIFDIAIWGDTLAVGGNFVAIQDTMSLDSNYALISLSADTLCADNNGFIVYVGNFEYDTIAGSPIIFNFLNFDNNLITISPSGDTLMFACCENGIFYDWFDPASTLPRPWEFPSVLLNAASNDRSGILISGKQNPEPWLPDSIRSVIFWRSSASFAAVDIHCNGRIQAMPTVEDTLLLVIGNYTELAGQNIKDLGWAESQIVSNTKEPLSKDDYRCYVIGNELIVEFTEPLSANASLHLYSIDGRHLRENTLSAGQSKFRFPMLAHKLSSYAIQTTDGVAGGILVATQ